MSDVPEPVADSTPVVVILSRPVVPQWLADALVDVRVDRLRAIILRRTPRAKPAFARFVHVALERPSRRSSQVALKPIAIDDLLPAVEHVESPQDLEAQLRQEEVVLDLTESRSVPPLRGHMVLSLWHGGAPATSPDALLRDVLQMNATVATTVVAEYGRRTWAVASARTAVSRWSLAVSRERAATQARALLPRAIAALRSPGRIDEIAAPVVTEVTNGTVALAAVRLAVSGGRSFVRRLTTTTNYGVAWGARDTSTSPIRPPRAMNWVDNPDGHFLADPFIARTDDGTFVFVEDFSRRNGYATIGVFELPDAVGTFRTVLDRGVHLSYPFVFRDPADGTWLMLPEMAAEHRIALFRATKFPDEWREDAVLVPGITAFDPTVLFRDGKYWLFYASGTPGTCTDDGLYLSFSDSLRGPFIPHPSNPIRSDVVGARPAGRLFEWDGRLIRPGQDSSREYGYAVVFYEVTSLTPTFYSEVEVGRLMPDWAPRIRGTHTWDFLDDIVVTDAKRVGSRRLPKRIRLPGAPRRAR
jgi:hypothetical protein